MPKAKSRTLYYAIARRALEELPVSAVLDMLRYDGAVVENNSPTGYWLFSITRDDGGRYPMVNVDRWRSFGITIAGESADRGSLCERLRNPDSVI